jgi:hypothetical protein
MELVVDALEPKRRLFAIPGPTAGVISLEGVPPGTCELTLLPAAGAGNVFPREVVQLEPDSLTVVELRCPLPSDPSVRAPLRGRFALWSEDAIPDLVDGMTLRIHALRDSGQVEPRPAWSGKAAEMERSSGPDELWAFESPPLPVGPYRAVLHPLGETAVVHVGPAGGWLDLGTLEVAHTIVELRDATGAPLESGGIRARLERADQHLPFSSPVHLRHHESYAEVVSAPGRLLVQTGLPERFPRDHAVTVWAGWNDLAVELRSVERLRLEAFAGREPCALPAKWWLDVVVEPLEASGGVVSFRLLGIEHEGSRSMELDLSEPGDYRVSFPTGPAGEQVPELLAHVHTGDSNAYRIDLQPSESDPNLTR